IKENDIYSLKGVCTLNEKQRQEQAQIKSESSKDSNKDRILSLTTEDFAHYFETTYEPPDIRKARKRGRDDIEVHYDFNITDEMQSIGDRKKILIRTYVILMNTHDIEVINRLY